MLKQNKTLLMLTYKKFWIGKCTYIYQMNVHYYRHNFKKADFKILLKYQLQNLTED